MEPHTMHAKIVSFALTASLLAASGGCSEDSTPNEGEDELIPVTFQSKWFPQAQFAGYYIAGGVPVDETGDGHRGALHEAALGRERPDLL